jgi:argininosuccinate lyase
VHMNIEAALTKRIGPAGAKLHTARSRNDQVALGLRLYVKAEIAEVFIAPAKFAARSARSRGKKMPML